MSFQIILTIHVLLALALIALILMQHGKGANAGVAFGSGSAGSVFGASGANSFLYKLTAIIATSFFVTSLLLAYIANDNSPSIQNDKAKSVVSKNNEVPEVLQKTIPNKP